MTGRAEQLAAALAQVRQRVAAACRAAGRDPAEVALLAVTKTWPASDARLLHGLGLRAFAENRDAEAAGKAAALADLAGVRWHAVGQVQTNKAASTARWAHVVESVDRVRLADALARAAERSGGVLEVLVQVALSADPGRGGCPPGEVPALADHVAALPALRLRGVMAVAPRGEQAAPAFARLAAVAARLRADHPDADVLSAGMSGDLEAAVAHGSTVVRVGTALLGHRPPPTG